MITLFNTYYNQASMLRAQLKHWMNLPQAIRENVKFLIVDDCSKLETSAKTVIYKFLPNININLTVYYINEDKYCNIGGARNLGLQQCTTDWVIISDIDHVVPTILWPKIIQADLSNKKQIYRFNRVDMATGQFKQHPAIMMLHKDFYWEIGGCDEDFVGNYGCTDVHFRYRAEQKDCEYVLLNDSNPSEYLQLYQQGETVNIDRSNTIPNYQLFNDKVKTGIWSTDYIRFTWKLDFTTEK